VGTDRKGGAATSSLEKDEVADPVSTAFAKWLIPTFGILFALIGYVVRSAYRSLLGFPDGGDGAVGEGGYNADAADFLRSVLTLLGDRLLSLMHGVPLGGHGLMLVLGLVSVLLAVGLYRLLHRRVASWMPGLALGIVLLALVTTKFIFFDAPLMRIENAIVGVGFDYERPKGEQRGLSLLDRLSRSRQGGLDELVSDRAQHLWWLIVCTRVKAVALPNNPDFGGSRSCTGDAEATRTMLMGEFDADLLLALLSVWPAALLVRQRTPVATSAGLLALAYLLTIPYAYGKLLKPVDFAYAMVRFEPGSLHGSVPKFDSVYAFVISRTEGQVTLLEAVPESCSFGESMVLRFSSLPVSKVLAIEQIYQRDVIAWKVLNEKKCPPPPPWKP